MPAGREHQLESPRSFARAGRSSAAGLASVGAGAIHVAAAAAHADAAPAMATFAALAVCQVGWGALALGRIGTRLLLVGALGNLVAVGGWVVAKSFGIGFVRGLEHAEPAQLADSLAALLAMLAVAALAGGRRGAAPSALGPALTGTLAVAIAAATVAGVTATSGHAHSHAHTHEPADTTTARHKHEPASTTAHHHAAERPDGVTRAQRARAARLVAVTRRRLPRFADVATARARGYASIGDAITGYEHYIKWSLVNDDKLLDPDRAESLVYRVDGDRRKLVAAMYMLREGATLDTVPDVGGRLTQWHVHDDLCFTDDATGPVVAGITTPGHPCRPPLTKRGRVPMLHVWIVPNACGPFAALDGLAAGQVKAGERRRCDHAHAARQVSGR